VNFDHLHLLLNHVPIIGFFVGVGLLLASFTGNNDDLRRSALIIFAAVALLTIPTFVSGVGADRAIAREPGISEALVRRHEGAAMLGLWFVEATGAAALMALWRSRRPGGTPRGSFVAVLLLAIVASILMGRTGNTGGDIRHPEPGAASGTAITEGLVGSIFRMLEIAIPAPDHTTLSRRGRRLAIDRHVDAGEGVDLVIDSTGLRLYRRGSWLRRKQAGRRNRMACRLPRRPTSRR